MDLFEGSYYRLNKQLLFYIGQWPLQTSNEKNFYRITTVLIVGSILLVEVIKFAECFGDLNSMIHCLPEMGVHFRSAVRFINCTVEATKMRELTNQIKEDWTVRDSESEVAILRSYAERGRLYTVTYTAYIFGTTIMLIVVPLVPLTLDIVAPLNHSRDRIFLIETEYFIDQEKNYFSILIHAIFALMYTSGILVAYDTMYAVYVQHVCSIFTTVGARLRSIGDNTINNQQGMTEDSTKRTDEAYDEIGACIDMHNNAMKIADLIESTNCACFFVVIGTSMLMITTTGYMTVMSFDQPNEALRFGVVAVAETIHLFYLFWPGHHLMVHSENIFLDAYSVYWYDLSPRAKKLLIMMMIRSFEPCKFTAGKILVLSMENYAAVIKFIECLGDLNGMMQCVPWLAIHFRSFVKLINSSVKLTKIRVLTNRIKDDWTIRKDELDDAILTSYAERGKLLTMIYVVYMFSALLMYLSIPLIPIILDVVTPLNQSRDRVFLLQTEYFIDQNEIYFYILIHAYITMPFALGIIIAYDTMYAVYVQHACGIFATLGARLQSIGGIASNSKLEMYNEPAKSKDEAYNDIVGCIKMHNQAVEIATLIESSTCISCLFVLATSILTITVTGFMIVTNLDQPSEALRAVLVVVGELIHLFYICWQGQVLMEHNEDIFVNAYNVDWCDISPRAKKLLILIMVRSLRPCHLTAGKVFVLSMENFATALKTSMSYFTVLLSMQ